MEKDTKTLVVDLLKTKSILKQDVYTNTKKWFNVFKEEIKNTINLINNDIGEHKDKIRLKIVDKSDTEIQLYIGSDVLVFQMHTNVFKIAPNNYVHQSSYIKSNPNNAYCGIINVYNFLADSYEYNRLNDLGYLIARIFINKEDHFFVEGKGQLEFLYKDFLNQKLKTEIIKDIILKISAYAINFDLLTPPYEKVSIVSVQETQAITNDSQLKTGKRLGFKFKSENDIIG
ncbi:MAG TPA: hypothetical protein EYG85_05255 [Crocinitomix sp.]|nr:hypothetical protein [Crocinitomix sp.]